MKPVVSTNKAAARVISVRVTALTFTAQQSPSASSPTAIGQIDLAGKASRSFSPIYAAGPLHQVEGKKSPWSGWGIFFGKTVAGAKFFLDLSRRKGIFQPSFCRPPSRLCVQAIVRRRGPRQDAAKVRLAKDAMRAPSSAAPAANEWIWGCSSVGRALQSHCRGRRFDSVQLHHLAIYPDRPVWPGRRRKEIKLIKKTDPR